MKRCIRILINSLISLLLLIPVTPGVMVAAPAPQQSATKKKASSQTGKGKAAPTTTRKGSTTASKGGKATQKNTQAPATKKGAKATANKKTAAQTSATKKGSTQPANKKTGQSSATRKAGKQATKRATQTSQPTTSAEAKKRQEATQREIKLTEQQIRENEKAVKSGLNELGKLETDISASRKIIQTTTGQIATLNGQISSLESGITANEKELKRLRDEYLKAVKKMRVARKNNSDLAFIFASDNFNQTLRRMRYLKQFSEWKDRQSAAIAGKTKELRKQKEELAEARSRQDAALKLQQAQEATLVKQHSRQDALVADLRKNGDALKSHLSKKQAEANQLRNQISQLIIAEERKAAEERARKEREEQARLAREEAARKAREEEARKAQLAKEAKLTDGGKDKSLADAGDKSASTAKDVKSAGGNDAKKQDVSTARKKDNNVKKEQKGNEAGTGTGKNYADARKRRPRSQAETQSSGKTEVASAASSVRSNTGNAGNFAAMKGSLPKPASGSFKVTSRFGRQALPDLPDVVYDNPGIDAEVSAGASALAVYGGKVSGVYMLPGYNTVVIVNHGSYYTVYGNIASPAVKVGDEVRAGQGLGALAADEDDHSHGSIHFEVWRSREKLNPLEWIRL